MAAIQSTNAAGRLVSGVRLNSPGGSLAEGAKIADTIRYAKVATVVVNGATCASACFVAFAAGAEKYSSYSAAVGVHGASVDGQENDSSRSATVAMAKVVKELGVPSSIIGQMVVTPPSQMVWLQPAELQSMGVTMTGKPGQAVSPPVAAQVPAGGPPGPGLAANAGLAKATAPTDNDTSWRQLISTMIAEASAANPGGDPVSRVCQPELKTCAMAIFTKSSDGKSMMARLTQDIDGKLLRRDVCFFNEYADIRECSDGDTHIKTREMKNSAGQWYAVQ